MKLLLSLISLAAILSMLVPSSVLGQNDFKVFVTGGNLIHELDLKATEGANGQIIPVSGFAIEADSVVQLHQNENLQVFTSTNEPERIDKVKVTTPSGQLVELTQIGTGWSLQGFASGVYLLDVIVDIPDGSKGAYETVLVILAPNEQGKDTTQVIKQVVKVDTKIVFKDHEKKDKKPDLRKICTFNPSDPRCAPKNGKCPPGFGTNEDGQCFWRGDCPDGYHRANDDETGRCVPDRDLKQCEDGSWAYKDDDCPEDWPQPIDCPDGSTVLEGEECPVDDEILPPCSLVAAGETCDNTEDEDSWTDEEVEEDTEESFTEEEEEEEDNDNGDDESFEDEDEGSDDEADASEDEAAADDDE